MSKTLFVEYRGQGFWAFDVVTAVLLKHLVDLAEQRTTSNPWLAKVVERWRVDTIVCGDCGLELDEQWSNAQIEVVVHLFETTCRDIGKRDEISTEEIEGWSLLDGNRVWARGLPVVRTKAVINLGNAIVALLKGIFPESPPGTWWFFGTEDQPKTIERRQ